MESIVLNLKGALSSAVRDLYKIQGIENSIDQIKTLVDTELWPRMALWLGINPNLVPNIAQVQYSKIEFMDYLTSDSIRYNPWQLQDNKYVFVNKQSFEEKIEGIEELIEQEKPMVNTYRAKDSTDADYIIQIPVDLEKWIGSAKLKWDEKNLLTDQKEKEDDK